MKKMLVVHAVALSCLAVFPEQEVNLNEHALRDGADKLIVLSSGDPGFVRDDGTHESPESVFDGDWNTLYKPLNTEVANIWVGLEFDSAFVISRVDYVGPEWYWWGAGNRTKGCVIEGANSADFSDAEVIATLGNSGRAMATVRTSGAGAAKTWKFARIRSPRAMIGDDDDSTCCGNIAELVFYGYEPEVQPLPSVPTIKTLQVYNRSAAISYDVPSDAFAVELQIKTAPDDEWRMVKEKSSALRDVAKYRVQLDADVGSYCAVRARSVNTSGVSEWSNPEILEDIPTALFGRVIGTRNGDQSAAFDGDFTTRTEQGEDWGSSLGLDFGAIYPIVGFSCVAPIKDDSWMSTYWFPGAVVEIADNIDFKNAVEVFRYTGTGGSLYPTELMFDKPVYGRYARLRMSEESVCIVAELSFLTTASVDFQPIPLQPSAQIVEEILKPAKVLLTWKRNPYHPVQIFRSLSSGGPWTLVGRCVAGEENWTDDQSPVAGTRHWYALAYEDECGHEGRFSDPVGIVVPYEQLERDSLTANTLREGCSIALNGTAYQGRAENITSIFDGREDTNGDLTGPGDAPLGVGIDFGEDVCMSKVCFLTHSNWSWRGYKEVTLYASDVGVDMINGIRACNDSQGHDWKNWHEWNVVEKSPHRYWYLGDKTIMTFAGDFSEVFFFGCRPSAIDSCLFAPSDLRIVDDGMNVTATWTNSCRRAKAIYLQFRKRETGEWTTLESVSLEPSGLLRGISRKVADGPDEHYVYRMVAEDGTERAFSAELYSNVRLGMQGLSVFVK